MNVLSFLFCSCYECRPFFYTYASEEVRKERAHGQSTQQLLWELHDKKSYTPCSTSVEYLPKVFGYSTVSIFCTNLATATPEYFRINDMLADIDLVRASASLPYLSKTIKYEGKELLDGGVVESIPIYGALAQGFDKNVVVLTRHKEFRKSPENYYLPYLFYPRRKAFIKALHERHNMYNSTVAFLEKEAEAGRVFLIRPSVPLNISRLESDPKKIQEIYDLGLREGRACLPALRQWLAEGKSEGENK